MRRTKQVAEHNAKATIQNSVNILGPMGNVTTVDVAHYTSRAQNTNKPHPRFSNQI